MTSTPINTYNAHTSFFLILRLPPSPVPSISPSLRPMERFCFEYRRQIAHAGLACVLSMSAPLIATPAHAQESAVKKELHRRIDNAHKAHALLKSGDEAYQKKDYKTAVQHYAEAFELLPNGSLNHELRIAAADRYATAATEHSRALAKGGSYNDARQLLDTVLKPEIAPAHLGALKLRQQVDDPLRYNHAITPEHVQDVVKVGRLLREAEGFYSLGQYDRAVTVYQTVLNIDPFNKAARRSMEKINAAKSDYYRAARDHTRSEMLAQVDKAWELYVPSADNTLPSAALTDPTHLGPNLRDKLEGITVDMVDLDNATLDEALDFVRIQSRLGDAPNAAGEQTGINLILNLGDSTSETARSIQAARVTLKARSLPLSKILDYITDQTRTQWRTDGVGVLVTRIGSSDSTLISKTFRVPPNFVSSAATHKKPEDDNPFGDESDNKEGKLAAKISITDFLKQNGVNFPDGASAQYIPSTNSLTVRNTAGNIDLIDQLVSLITDEEPVQVIVRTTIMRISEEKLKELSFDWAITPLLLGNNTFLGGGTQGNGTPLGIIPALPISFGDGNPITSGNRSGNGAIPGTAIENFINSSTTGIATNSNLRAPGILKVTGVVSNMQIQMMMRGLNQKTGADVMVKPSTISRSGERSKIEIIREFIYPTEYEPPELPQSIGSSFSGGGGIGGIGSGVQSFPVTPAHPTAFETRNIGITLEVEPTVGPDRRFIELSLKPEMVEFEGFVNYGTPINGSPGTDGTTTVVTDNRILMPVFKIVRLQHSTLTIQDGATVVLGGGMTSRKTKTEDKVPILGDIPFAGRLFRSDASRTFREAVIVMVNAELVDPTGALWRNR
jgi:general secretion pathway protein D